MTSTDNSTLMIYANTPNLRFVRFVHGDAVAYTQQQLLKHISQLGLSIDDVTIDVSRNTRLFIEFPSSSVKFSNICVKIEHFDTTKVHRDEVVHYCTKISDGFGEFMTLQSKYGTIRTCTALTSSSVRAARSTADIHRLILHAFNPHSIQIIRVHMMIATKSLGHPIIVQGCHAVEWLRDQPNWRGRVRVLDEEVGRRQCLEITWLNPQWLQQLNVPATPSQCILNLYRNGLVNIFLAFSPGPLFEVDLEHKFSPFIDEIMKVVRACT